MSNNPTAGTALFAELENQFQPLFNRYNTAETAGTAISDALYDLEQADGFIDLARALIAEIQQNDESQPIHDVVVSAAFEELKESVDRW